MKLVITYTHGEYDSYAYRTAPMEYESIFSLEQEIQRLLPEVEEFYKLQYSERGQVDRSKFVIKHRKASFDVKDLLYETKTTDYKIQTLQDWFNENKNQ